MVQVEVAAEVMDVIEVVADTQVKLSCDRIREPRGHMAISFDSGLHL